MDMSVCEAQADMRRGYCSGGAGILVSAIAWAVAAGVASTGAVGHAIVALLIGGALIHPVAVGLCKLMGAQGSHTKGNPLGTLAGASVFWLIFCIPIAYVAGLQRPAWFFVSMLLIIGGRYLVFATLYGMRLYWALGLALAIAAGLLAWLAAPAFVVAAIGAALEAAFAIACLLRHRRAGVPGAASPGTLRGTS